MTGAYQCDKCGEFETGEPKTNWRYTRNHNSDTRLNTQQSFDLCSHCSDKLMEVIKQ